MCVETKRIIKSCDVVFLGRTDEMEGVHDDRLPLKQVQHFVVDEIMNDDEPIKSANRISLKEKPTKCLKYYSFLILDIDECVKHSSKRRIIFTSL